VVLFARERAMDEEAYCEHYPYRIFALHAAAYFKDRFLVLGVVFAGLTGGEKDAGGEAKTKFDLAGRAASGGAPQLYSWFRRKPGRVYNVISSEAPASQLRGVAGEARALKRDGVPVSVVGKM
jgi:hypothetical protein